MSQMLGIRKTCAIPLFPPIFHPASELYVTQKTTIPQELAENHESSMRYQHQLFLQYREMCKSDDYVKRKPWITDRSQIFQRLLADTILFERCLAILDHIVHDQAVYIALQGNAAL